MALVRSRRLETLLGAPLDQLSFREISALPAARVSEAFDLDFKSTAYGTSDKEKRDLCADVASFANSAGGLIILGVDEDEHAVASSTPGVRIADSERNRILLTLASGVAPLPALEINAIPSEADPSFGWLVIEVPRSARAPHAVLVNEGLRYPVRNGTTTRYLAEPEVASMYQQRFGGAQDLDERLHEVALDCSRNLNRDFGPWLVVALIPEHAGRLEINQSRLKQMQQTYQDRDWFDMSRSGAGTRWVRTGRGRYTMGDGPYPNQDPRLSTYGYSELHTNGAGSYAVEQFDIGEQARRRQSAGLEDGEAVQMVSDEMMALSILSGLRRLASHARDVTGAAGSATVQAQLLPSPGRSLVIGHPRRWIADSRSGNAMEGAAVGEAVASLDDLADPSSALVATAARLHDQLGHCFGIPEMGQLSSDGEIRRRYWQDISGLEAWATEYAIDVIDEGIPGL